MEQEFLEYVRQAMRDWGVPGVAVGVVKDGKTVLAEGLGVRCAGSGEPVGTDTQFPLGSVTKGFTATAVGLLVQEGKLRWDDRVADLLPAFRVVDPYVSGEATVRDLLCHRSGVEDAPLLYTGSSLAPAELIRKVRLLGQKASFRSAYVYNNLMYLVLGAVIQELGEATFADFLQSRLFGPLGMGRTTVGRDLDEDRASGHVRFDADPVVVPRGCGDMDVVAPSAAVRSTVRDLLAWARLCLNKGKVGNESVVGGEVLHETHTLQMVARHPRFLYPESQFQGYGLGWPVGDHRGRKVLAGGGRIAGGTAEIVLVPGSRLGVVVLGNMDLTWMGYAVAYEAVDRFLGDPSADWSRKMLKWAGKGENGESPQPVAKGPTSLDPQLFVGHYSHRLFGSLDVGWHDRLHLEYNREIRGSLTHETFDTFRLGNPDNPLVDHRGVRASFRLDPLGAVESLELAFPVPHHDREFERVSFHRDG